MAERYFNLREAQDLLPLIEPYLEQAQERKQKLEKLDEELAKAGSKIMVLGGSIPPFAELSKKRKERERLLTQLQDAVTKIQETGCLVKDLDMGLVDFPCRLKGEDVYLCWKLGEERIGFWHGINEGFAGRKPLDDTPPEKPPGRKRVQ